MTKRQKVVQRKLRREFHSLNLNVLIRAREQILGKLRVWTLQERRTAERRKFQEQNHHWNTQRKFLVNGKAPSSNEVSPIEVVRDFWRKVVDTVGKVNNGDSGVKEWLKETRKRVGGTTSEGPDSIDETKMIMRKALKKAKSWSAPWPDGIHTFWWKALPSAQSALVDVLWRVVSGELSFPDWLTRGHTLLYPKKGDLKSAANYRPIACLNTMYKTITAYLASELLTHTYTNGLLPMAQRDMIKGRWGCVD